jgi:anti-sigma B factor antagonist
MPFTIQENKKDDVTRELCLEGEMTIYNAMEMKEGLLQGLHDWVLTELDLSGVNEIDTAGFQCLVLAGNEAEKRGVGLALVSLSAAVQALLELVGMKDYLQGGEA